MPRLLLAPILALALATPALALETAPYTPAALAAAQAAQKPILVEIDAPWCPNCAKQRPIIAKMEQEPAYKDLVVLRIDFDSQKDDVRAMKATMQSTLIAFHGKDEAGRVVGVTDETAIRTLVDKTKG